MARPGYTVGDERFPTKKAVQEKCSALLKKRDLSLDDETFLRALLENHPEAEAKIGCGVQRIFIGPDGHGRFCFWLERTDGTKTDWSFVWCLKGGPDKRADVLAAFRFSVKEQVTAFRAAAYALGGTVLCALTSVPVASDDSHVDHTPPDNFLSLVELFMSERALTYESIAIQPTRDQEVGTFFEADDIRDAWRDFHRERAKLRIVSKRANLSQGTGRRSKH